MQYALYSVFVLLVIGGFCFLYTARFVIADRNAAKMQMHSGTSAERESLLRSSSVASQSCEKTVAAADPLPSPSVPVAGEHLDADTSIHSLPPEVLDDGSLQSFPPRASDSFDSDLNHLVRT